MSYHNGPKIVTNGLVLYLDAGNSKSYPRSGTVWTDLSGNGNNGTLTNGPTYSSLNKGNISFDGVNDYCTFTFNPIQQFTCNILIKYNAIDILSNNTHYSMINNGSGGDQSNIGEFQKYNIRFNRSGSGRNFATQFYQTDFTEGAQGLSITGPSFEDSTYNNKWSMHSTTLSSSLFGYYVNGNLYSSLTGFDSTKLQIFNTFLVSKVTGDSWIPSKINVGLIQIYSRSLTSQEITQNYNALKGRYNL